MGQPWQQLLRELSTHGKDLNNYDTLEEYKQQAKQLCSGLQLQLSQLVDAREDIPTLDAAQWQAYSKQGISVPDAIRALSACIKYGSGTQPHIAAALLSWMLRAEGAPAHHILDTLVLSALLQRIKDTVQPPSSSSKAQDAAAENAGDDDDGEGAPAAGAGGGGKATDDLQHVLALEVLRNLGAGLQQVSLRSHQDALQICVDTAVDLLTATKAVKVPNTLRSQGFEPGSFAAGAYELLKAVVHGRHGSCPDIAALVLPKLTPLLLGTVTGPGKRSPSEVQGIKTATLEFVKELHRSHPEIQESMAALARHVCLKAPDKADSRAAAIKAASDIAAELPSWEQDQMAGFAYLISRSNKPCHRTLAVGLASCLLMHLPEPFKATTFLQPPAAQQGAPAGFTRAPWSVVCLAAMLHRCSDRSAVVRARGLADLAEVVDCFGELLAADPASEQYTVAEAFVLGLAAAAHVQVPRTELQQPAGRPAKARSSSAAAGAGADEDAADAGESVAGGTADEEMADAPAPVEDGGVEGLDAQEGAAAAAAAAAAEGGQPAGQGAPGFLEAYMPCKVSTDLGALLALVHRRCADPKAAVRKGALQLLEHLVVMRASWQGYPRQLPGAEDLLLLEAATADPLVTVRKAALVALSRLLEIFPAEPLLCSAWVRAALPLVRDTESSIQDCLLDWTAALLVDKAADARKAGSDARNGGRRGGGRGDVDRADVASVADTIMTEVDEEDIGAAVLDLRPLLAAIAAAGRSAAACLGRLCGLLAGKKKLKPAFVAAGLLVVIQSSGMGSREALGGWLLLKEVTAQDPKAPCWQLLQQRWRALQAAAAAYAVEGLGVAGQGDAAEGTVREPALALGEAGAAGGPEGLDQHNKLSAVAEEGAALLLVISNAAESFPDGQAAELADELLKHLLSFTLPPATAAAHVAALYRLSSTRACSAAVGKPADWSRRVYTAAHDLLHRYVSSSTAQQQQLEQHASAAVFTCGEVALLRACPVPGGLSVLLQALTAEHLLPASGAADAQEDVAMDEAYSSQEAAAGAGEGSSGRRAVPMGLQAHTWVAFGKLCLVDEGLAKKCVPLFVQALGASPHPVVRNNIMVALSDMVIQFTALVDSHMPRLAACIRDPHELVRRQALALLANLLMKDYVKWRGTLFHRFLLALVDPSPAVRHLAEFLLTDTLATKAPLLAYNHFLESLFVLNGCTAGLQAARGGGAGAGGGGVGAGELPVMAGDEQGQYMLPGPGNRVQRDVIYAALLEPMAPEHKFNTAAKLCSCVLAGVVDGLLPLAECSEVLRDALHVLGCKDIKVTASRFAGAEEEEGPGGSSQPGGGAAAAGAGGAAAMVRARGKVISALMKRHLVESVVPVMVELRRLLMEEKHPLLQDLMSCFASLLKEYKGEVEEMFVADKLLAKEIMFDIRQAEQKAKQAAAAAAAAPTPAAAAAAAGAAPVTQQLQRTQQPGMGGVQQWPPGVLPGTPVAAEVLRTAERERHTRQEQQAASLQGDGSAPATSSRPVGGTQGPGTGLKARGSRSTAAAGGGGFKTPGPATGAGTPLQGGAVQQQQEATAAGFGSVQSMRSGPRSGGKTPGMAATPAPLSVRKTPRQLLQEADENRAPDSSGALQRSLHKLLQAGPAPATISAATIVLPSPFKEQPQQRWNIPEQVVEGSHRKVRPQRAKAAAAAVGDADVEQEEEAAAAEATAGGRRGSRSTKASSRGATKEEAIGTKQRASRGAAKAGAPFAVGPEAVKEVPVADRSTRSRTTRSQKARA